MTDIGSAVRTYNRFELKYVLPRQTAELLKQELLAYLQPDSHGDHNGNYALSSLYYDSPRYHFYWEKMEGIKFRRKLRIRHYETQARLTPDAPVFVEIKQRLDRVTQKRRVLMPYRDARKLCNERTIPDHRPHERAVIEEIHAMTWQHNLCPVSIVSYLRQALIGTEYDIGLRVTFDTNLRYRGRDLQLHSKKIGRFLLPPDVVIMEIKVNERIPYWLTELVAAHNLRLIRVSKYCLSMEAAQRVPRASYQVALGHFGPVTTSSTFLPGAWKETEVAARDHVTASQSALSGLHNTRTQMRQEHAR